MHPKQISQWKREFLSNAESVFSSGKKPSKKTNAELREEELTKMIGQQKIERNNQVWATDITYIPMKKCFMYLTAIIDIKSRYVLHWSLSNSMDAKWCAEVLEDTIAKHGKPEIINIDQGSQYTSEIFTNAVLTKGIKLSMDGKGRATDNAFIERLWRSVKYEKVYLYPTTKPLELTSLLKTYFDYYNNERRHSSIGDKTPAELINRNENQLVA